MGNGMRILGIDPGLAIVGWGIVERVNGMTFRPVAYGSINTPAHTEVPYRLSLIYKNLNQIIEKYHPDEMAVEELFFTNNQTTGIAVAEARGVILLVAEQHNIPVAEYTPPEVKQAVVGYGKAEKHQVIDMVTRLLQLPAPPKPDDTADAIAIALCHGQSAGAILRAIDKQR